MLIQGDTLYCSSWLATILFRNLLWMSFECPVKTKFWCSTVFIEEGNALFLFFKNKKTNQQSLVIWITAFASTEISSCQALVSGERCGFMVPVLLSFTYIFSRVLKKQTKLPGRCHSNAVKTETFLSRRERFVSPITLPECKATSSPRCRSVSLKRPASALIDVNMKASLGLSVYSCSLVSNRNLFHLVS